MTLHDPRLVPGPRRQDQSPAERRELPRQLHLPHDLTAPAVARQFTQSWCRHHGVADPYDSLLVVSELVTHALRHSVGVSLTLTLAEDGIWVSVDGLHHPAAQQQPGPSRSDELEGSSQRVITALTAQWGIQPSVDGTTLSAVIRREPA